MLLVFSSNFYCLLFIAVVNNAKSLPKVDIAQEMKCSKDKTTSHILRADGNRLGKEVKSRICGMSTRKDL